MAHLVAWQQVALDVAKELAVGEASPRKSRADADWEARGGDVVNAEIQRHGPGGRSAEVRAEFGRVSGELRGYLTVVPEARWIKNADQQRFFIDETLDHYDEHRRDLEADPRGRLAVNGPTRRDPGGAADRDAGGRTADADPRTVDGGVDVAAVSGPERGFGSPRSRRRPDAGSSGSIRLVAERLASRTPDTA